MRCARCPSAYSFFSHFLSIDFLTDEIEAMKEAGHDSGGPLAVGLLGSLEYVCGDGI